MGNNQSVERQSLPHGMETQTLYQEIQYIPAPPPGFIFLEGGTTPPPPAGFNLLQPNPLTPPPGFEPIPEQESLIAEKPDQATIDRMRQVEESAQDKPSFLKTLGQEAIDKLGGLGETVITAGSAIPGFALSVGSGISQAARDFAAGNFDPSKVDVLSAKEEAEKKMGELIYQPKTSFGQTTTTALAAPVTAFRAGVKAGAKAITSDPQAQAAIELAGDAALAFLIPKLGKITRDTGKMVSKAIYEDSIKQVVKKGLETKHSPEVMNVIESKIRENVTPGTILEEVKRNVGTRKAEVREAVPRLTEPIVEPPGIDIRVSRDTVTGDTVIRIPKEAPRAVTEQAPAVSPKQARREARYQEKFVKPNERGSGPIDLSKMSDEQIADLDIMKYPVGAERDFIIQERAKAAKRVALSLKDGDVFIDEEGARIVVLRNADGFMEYKLETPDPRNPGDIGQGPINDLFVEFMRNDQTGSSARFKKAPRPAQTPVSLPAEGPTVVPEPKIEGGGYTPTGKQPWEMTREEYLAQSDDVALMRKLRDQDYDPKNTLTTAGDRGRSTKALNASIRNERSRHEQAVVDAVRAGNPVPAEVLADYPDLAKPAQQPAPPSPPTVAKDLRSEGYIPIYRGVGKRGFAEVKVMGGGVHGDGVYFYTEPSSARSYASWPEGGVITGFIKPEDAIIKGNNVAVVKDPSKIVFRGKIPIDDTYLTGEKWIARTEQALSEPAPQPAPPTGGPSGIPAAEYVKHKASGTLFRVLDNRNPASVTVDNNGKPMVLDRKYVEPVKPRIGPSGETLGEFQGEGYRGADKELVKEDYRKWLESRKPSTPTGKQPWEMTGPELRDALSEAKKSDKQIVVDIFGPEKAKEYERLQRRANSLLLDSKVTDAAYAEVEKMEASITEAQRNRIYGIGEQGFAPDDLSGYVEAIQRLDFYSPEALGDSLKYKITDIGNKKNPAEMNAKERYAYVALKEAYRVARENGWDTKVISSRALRGAASRFSQEDFDIMLGHFNKNRVSTEGAKALGEGGSVIDTAATKPAPQPTGEPSVEVLPEGTAINIRKDAEAKAKAAVEYARNLRAGTIERVPKPEVPAVEFNDTEKAKITKDVTYLTSGSKTPTVWRQHPEQIEANRNELIKQALLKLPAATPTEIKTFVNNYAPNIKGERLQTRKEQAISKEGPYPIQETEEGTIDTADNLTKEMLPAAETGPIKKKPVGEQEVAYEERQTKDIFTDEQEEARVIDILNKAVGGDPKKLEIMKSKLLADTPETDAALSKRLGVPKSSVSHYHRKAIERLKNTAAFREIVNRRLDKLTGDEFDKITATLADKMEKDLGPVKGPKVGLTVEMAHPIPEPPKGGEKFTFPEGTEERYDAAKHLVKPTTIQKVSDFLADAYHGMSRVYQDLPRGPEWVEVVQTLKNNEKQPGIISDKLARTYKSMYYKLNQDTYDLTARRALLNDLLHEADAGHDLPFGFNEKSLRDVSSKLDAFIKDIAPVHEALKNRADVWDGLRKEYVYWREKAGHDVEDILNKPDYFRHKVLEVAKSEYNKVGPGKKLRLRTGQGFLKKRGGSEMDILSDLVSADYEVMGAMLRDIADAKALVIVRKVGDEFPRFKAEAKKQGVPIEEVIPEEYTKWQPKEGHLFYIADTLPAKIAEKIMTDKLTDIGVVKNKLRKSLAMGQERETWIIKKELAATLDKLGAQKEAKVMGGVFKSALTAWKKWTLLSPRRAIKYNFRNLTGDSDHIFVGSPGVFARFPQAMKELWPAFAGDRPITGNLRDFAERGGFQSTLQIQDIGTIMKLPVYRNLYKASKLNYVNPLFYFKKYWRFANNATNYRESIGRYAAYLKYLEDMQKDPNGKPKNFGASFPEEIMALSDIKDRAFRLSNELLGPYDEVSPVGVEISSKIYPFWRWKEVNAKFYARIIKNIANNDEAAVKTAKSVLGGARIAASVGTRTLIGAGRFALKAMGLTALLTAWNNLVFEDEEKDLPEDVRNRLHLVLGRDKDGKVIAFTRLGAMGDMLEWFGMDNAYGHMTDYLNGRKTMKEIVTDMVKSPVNIIASGISPFIKAPFETLTRRTLFPDVFDPKVIRDRGSYLARQVGLEDEYKAIVGKPGRPYVSTLSQMAVYKYDPLESAYYDFLDIKRGYLKSIGKEGGGGPYLSPSSNALYNMKLAYRWGEHKLANKYMEEYANIVVTQHRDATPEELKKLIVKGIRQSLTSLHPLWGIKQDDWADYVRSLDPEAKDTLAKALRFYSEILLGKSDVKEND